MFLNWRSPVRGLAALTLTIGLLGADSVQALCGENSPAFPVPEFRGSTRLWPNNFRPGNPGQQLPPNRDSTQYVGTTYPYAGNGHEQFIGMDIAGGRLFVLYNVGISVWDINGANAENPLRQHYRDGIEGHWLFHPGTGEDDGYVLDMAAMQDPSNSNRILVVTSGKIPVGVGIWRFDKLSNQLSPIYQDTSKEGAEVTMAQYGGRVYAFISSNTGPFVLDVTQSNTLSAPCLDTACPGGIYKGKIGTANGSRYIDAIERNGIMYVASSMGGISPNAPLPQIWELDPASPTTAVRRYLGATTVRDTNSAVLLKKGANYYMGVIENKRLRIYNINDCLDSTGCTGLPSPLYDEALRNNNWTTNYLTYSESEGTPFLYAGMAGGNLSGTSVERLIDLSNLGSSNFLPEITAGGQTYTDACNGLGPIGYWADYYTLNDNGLRNLVPNKGKFNGGFFYRTTVATIDVHVRTNIVQDPTITTTVTSPAPYWFGDGVNFSAGAQFCDGPENWTWFASDTNASGLGPNDFSATINWNLCDGNPCPDKNIEVWALKQACQGDPDLIENRATITVKDPRTDIEALTVTPTSQVPDTYPLCTVLNIGATIDGKTPFTYAWSIRNEVNQQVHSGTSSTLIWDTRNVDLNPSPEIFADGFESGNTSAWSGERQAEREAQRRAAAKLVIDQVMGAGSANFTVDLTANNSTGVPDTARRSITLTALGSLAFVGASPITVTNQGGAQYRFQAATENATQWRWEFEDPGNGTTSGCQFYTKCRILNYGVDDGDVTNSWTQPNLNGTYRATVTIANCLDVAPLSREVSFNVTGIATGVAPLMTNFTVNAQTTPHCSLDLGTGFLDCRTNQQINFIAAHTGTATHYDLDWEGDGTFETSVLVTSAISKTYTTAGLRTPKIRARNNAETPSTALNLTLPLNIIP